MRFEGVHITEGNVSKYGGIVLERIMSFAGRYGCDVDLQVLWLSIAQSMCSQSPLHIVFVVVDGESVVGHAVCEITSYYGKKSVTIEQLEIDKGATDGRAELIDSGLEAIIKWSSRMGADKVSILARNDKVARLFQRLGFKRTDLIPMELKHEPR